MFRVALKDLLARKRRLVTTGLAVVLGIAFLTGTQLLSAALSDSIEELIGDVYKGIDAVVRSTLISGSSASGLWMRPRLTCRAQFSLGLYDNRTEVESSLPVSIS